MAGQFTGPVQAARDRSGRQGVKSREASGMLDDLLRAPALLRRQVIRDDLKQRDLEFLLVESDREYGTPFRLWYDTPSGFTEDVLGETIWSKQRQILDQVPRATRTMVPAGFGVGKTHLAARSVLHFVATEPVGGALAVTTATRFRQVRYQLWPHIRKAHARAGLPGRCDTTQLKMPDRNGVDTVVAYGFSAPENDEAAMQGIHAVRLLLVVDEAGGIARIIGAGTNNLLTGDARMLAIGNPAMDDPRSWFETMCAEGEDPEQPSTVTIAIPTTDSPAITGEPTPLCRDCDPNPNGHHVAIHLPNQEWVDRTLKEFGPDHPYVIAKVHARFPRNSSKSVLPTSWVEGAMQVDDPDGPEYVRLCDLELEDETEKFAVKRGAWIRLGVDVAADGGDEFAIYRMIGDTIHEVHRSAGSLNASQVDVAEKILEQIERATRLARAIGSQHQIRVKVDKNGLGHGAVGMLERWGPEGTGRHRAEVVGVMVSESPEHDDEGKAMRPNRKRDEMWLAFRDLLMPDPSTGFGRLRLRIPHKCFVQLSTPHIGWNSAGLVVVESKASMKARGVDSPDLAEAALLCVYEPHPFKTKVRRGLINR